MDKPDEKYDGVLGQVLGENQGYEGFFTAIFGFLRRRTDFFSNSKQGEEIVARVGKAQVDIYLKDKKHEQEKSA